MTVPSTIDAAGWLRNHLDGDSDLARAICAGSVPRDLLGLAWRWRGISAAVEDVAKVEVDVTPWAALDVDVQKVRRPVDEGDVQSGLCAASRTAASHGVSSGSST